MSGTDADVKAKREKTVKTWLTAGILGSKRGDKAPDVLRLCLLWIADKVWFRGGGADGDRGYKEEYNRLPPVSQISERDTRGSSYLVVAG